MKNFDNWNKLKKLINDAQRFVQAKPRDVWWSTLGVNVGSEQDGKGDNFTRPVVIVKRLSKNVYYVFPLSTQCKNMEMHIAIINKNIDGFVLIDQMRALDRRRLVRKMGVLDESQFSTIVAKFTKLFT